jgi:hypothetical protein
MPIGFRCGGAGGSHRHRPDRTGRGEPAGRKSARRDRIARQGDIRRRLFLPYDKLPGVSATISGYMGGAKRNPAYKEASTGRRTPAAALGEARRLSRTGFDRNIRMARRRAAA